MRVLLLRYNKVHDISLEILEVELRKSFDVIWGSLPNVGYSIDLLPQSIIDDYLSSLDIDAVIIGDVFWPTGQHICASCNHRGIKTFLLQHGQWVYVKNKKKLQHYPSCTMLLGQNVTEMCSSWSYARHSRLSMTGNPRYDSANGKVCRGSYMYFSPPVIEELVHGVPNKHIRYPFLRCLEKLSGIDSIVPIVIQPHYREARTTQLRQLFPRAQFADPNIDPLRLIRGSNKVIASRNSTIVLDAIAHKKITVLTDLSENDSSFFKRGYFGEFALESDNREQFIKNIVVDIKIDHRNEYVERAKKHIYLGNASERIANLLKGV